MFASTSFETYFVGRSVAETGEEREESTGDRGSGLFSEDDLVQVRCRLDLDRKLDLFSGGTEGLCTLPTLLINRFAVVSTG